VHEIHRRACIDEGFYLAGGIVRHLRVVVVADPGIEQVAEDVERIRPGNVLLQKAKKTPGGDRAFVG
jgi:hypothetical protein